MRSESEGGEIVPIELGLVLFVFGVCAGWAMGYVQGCHKRGDYTK